MRNFLILTKNQFDRALGSLLWKKDKKRGSAMSAILVIGVLFAAFMALMTFQAHHAAELFVPAGFGDMILANGYMLALVASIFTSLQVVSGGKRVLDADMLLALPISRFAIVASRAISRYLFAFAVILLFLGPYTAAYMMVAGFSATVFFATLILLLVLPFIAVSINLIVDFLSVTFFRNSSFSNILRSVFVIILTLALLGVYFFALNNTNNAPDPDTGRPGHLDSFPVAMLLDFARAFDITALLIILAVTVLPLILGLYLNSLTYGKQNPSGRAHKVDIRAGENRGAIRSILSIDTQKYIQSPAYMINSFLGVLMLFIFSIAVFFLSMETVAGFLGIGADDAEQFAPAMLVMVFAMLVGLSSGPAAAISLEGKSFWVLKTMPVDTRQILIAKTMFNIISSVPFVIIAAVATWIAWGISFPWFLAILLAPIFVAIFSSFLGVYLNLVWPKLNWDSEAQAIRNSTAALVLVLCNMLLIPALFVLLLVINVGATATAWIMVGGFAAIAAGSVTLLMTHGIKLFDKISIR
ncbi:MAG: hypothetical protein FWE38_03470 [Firmicutes bacterium]|nr:hypothetical protein [Bacillota bacterium]